MNFILQNKTLRMLFNEKSVYLLVIDVTQVSSHRAEVVMQKESCVLKLQSHMSLTQGIQLIGDLAELSFLFHWDF